MPELSVSLRGADQFEALARRLRAAGRTDLVKELRREMREPPKLLERAVKAEIPPRMPRGYEQPLSQSLRFRAQQRLGAVVGVTVEMRGRGDGGGDRDVRALDRGVLRHPVHGRRRRTTRGRVFTNPWVVQRVPAGFFSDPARRVLREVQDNTIAALDRVTAKIAGS